MPPQPAGTGRFAPSPTGRLHLGNLRTALLAWLFARSQSSPFFLRMEDLDLHTSSVEHETEQCIDLRALGLDWDGAVVRQSERFAFYYDAIDVLRERGLTYPCYCTRREIQQAAAAPNAPLNGDGRYPGTCRNLSAGARAERETTGRPPALRLLANNARVELTDRQCGAYAGTVDDFVLQRNDGVPAYNLAVVVDDRRARCA